MEKIDFITDFKQNFVLIEHARRLTALVGIDIVSPLFVCVLRRMPRSGRYEYSEILMLFNLDT
jgi:hypothetical protein